MATSTWKGNKVRIQELQVAYRFVLARLEMIWVKQFEWNGCLNNRKRKNWLINTRLVFFFPSLLLLFRPLFSRLYFSADSDI